MKKLALAIGLGVYVLFGASRAALAADVAGGRLTFASRDQSPATAVIGTNSRLLFVNVALYPDTTDSIITASASAHGEQERADMSQPYTSADRQRLICGDDMCIV
jgi:hypothetical protein